MVLALPVVGASEDQKTSIVFQIIHRRTPARVCRVDTDDGRSPGSRIVAPSRLPGASAAPVAYPDETSRSQLRGQLRIWLRGGAAAPHSLFTLIEGPSMP